MSDRLSSQDVSFLYLEQPSTAMHVGSVMVFNVPAGGLDVDRLAHIDEYPTSPRYTDVERQALAYADAMTALPTTVTDDQVAGLEAALGRAGLVELTHVIALENMRARSNHALGVTDKGFAAACAVPDRSDPQEVQGRA